MNLEAIDDAAERLERASTAIERMKSTKSSKEARTAWSEFLHAASTFFCKLEQGAKGNGQDEAWYGRKKKQRKDDEALAYIHQARDIDEHGLCRVSKSWKNHQVIGLAGMSVAVPEGEEILEHNVIYADRSRRPAETVVTDALRLEPVRNRGRTYSPPVFFSQPLEGVTGGSISLIMTPANVADRAISQLTDILAEANARVPQ